MVAPNDLSSPVRDRLEWLAEFAQQARSMAGRPRVGIFGTSIAGTWLFAELAGGIEFFVDEDPNRIGQAHLGKPIFSPAQIPLGSDVLLPMPPLLAGPVAERLSKGRGRIHEPPAGRWAQRGGEPGRFSCGSVQS
jgi:hypothetical protein